MKEIWFKFPRMEWWGILTLIFMLSMHIDPTLKAGILIQICSTIFLVSGFLQIKRTEVKTKTRRNK